MNELSRAKKLLLLRALVRGNGVLDVAEIVECDPGTVLRYIKVFGEALADSHDRLVRGVAAERLEVDEVWSYVYGKSRNKRRFLPGAPAYAGDYFTWTALDPDSKLLASYHISKRHYAQAKIFLTDTKSRLKPKVDKAGRKRRLLITTDGLPMYRNAVSKVFGADADHVVIKKVLKSRWNPETGEKHVSVVSMTKESQSSRKVNLKRASTSRNERSNATIRNFIGRMQRQTYGFSKKLDNHRWALAIYAFWYNFRKEHRSLRGATPAMRAEIAKKVWSWDDILAEVERYWADKPVEVLPRELDGEPLLPMSPGEASSTSEFFVCLDLKTDRAIVHAGWCNNCKFGLGRGGKGSGEWASWYEFADLETAKRAGELLADEGCTDCRMCVTRKYRTRWQPV